MSLTQTSTPFAFSNRPSKEALVEEFVGKPLDDLRTPAFIVDRSVFAQNCAKMHETAKSWGTNFRAHLKTHKTAEGARLQLNSSADKTDRVVVSTLMEAWSVVNAGLVKDGTVKDILYGLPVGLNKVQDVSDIWDAISAEGATIRLIVDHPDQVKFLDTFEAKRTNIRKWSVFVKIDGGQKRAGVPVQGESFQELLKVIFESSNVSVYGFYAHAGNSYASTSLDEASSFLSSEVQAVNGAAKAALDLLKSLGKDPSAYRFTLSVGSTPTAHAAGAEALAKLKEVLVGDLELHAGNYPMNDLQQHHTSLVDFVDISQRVRATVVSYYPGRGENGTDEAMIDAGGIAFSKDTGPSGDFGAVLGTSWRVGRMSQEHGLLTRSDKKETLQLGQKVEVVGQHACMIAAAYPWYYVVDPEVDGGKTVVDVWVPWKGW